MIFSFYIGPNKKKVGWVENLRCVFGHGVGGCCLPNLPISWEVVKYLWSVDGWLIFFIQIGPKCEFESWELKLETKSRMKWMNIFPTVWRMTQLSALLLERVLHAPIMATCKFIHSFTSSHCMYTHKITPHLCTTIIINAP